MTMILPIEGETMLKELSKLPKKGRMLELGTGFGHSASYFSKNLGRWKIYTVDGYGLYGTGRNLFNTEGNKIKQSGLERTITFLKNNAGKNVITIIGNSNTIPWEFPINALFIDADHSYKWIKRDTEHYMDFVVKGGIIMYHDYNDNWDVKKYFDAEMRDREGWKCWSENGIAFAKKI